MATHFPMVPIGSACWQAHPHSLDGLRPVVLVVDDEPAITETLAAILNSAGFAALTAFDGFSALEIALLIPPHVLITDLAMPGMDGLDLAARVTRAVPDCEVILFSGHAAICDLADRTNSLAFEFATLMKPIHPARMIDCILERLARRGGPVLLPSKDRRLSFSALGPRSSLALRCTQLS